MPIDDESAEASNEEIEIQPLLPEQQAVPQKLHLIWFGAYLPDKYQDIARQWEAENPDYQVIVHYYGPTLSPRQVADYQLAAKGGGYEARDITTGFVNEDYLHEMMTRSPPKEGNASDIYRAALLYNEGGVYSDFDTPPLKLGQISAKYGFKFPFEQTYRGILSYNDFLAAVPGSQFFDQVNQLIHERRKEFYDTLHATGPGIYGTLLSRLTPFKHWFGKNAHGKPCIIEEHQSDANTIQSPKHFIGSDNTWMHKTEANAVEAYFSAIKNPRFKHFTQLCSSQNRSLIRDHIADNAQTLADSPDLIKVLIEATDVMALIEADSLYAPPPDNSRYRLPTDTPTLSKFQQHIEKMLHLAKSLTELTTHHYAQIESLPPEIIETLGSLENGLRDILYQAKHSEYAPTPRHLNDNFEKALDTLKATAFSDNDTKLEQYISQQSQKFQGYIEACDEANAQRLIAEVQTTTSALNKEPSLKFIREKVNELHGKSGPQAFGSKTKACRIFQAMADVDIDQRLQFSTLPEGNTAGKEVMAVRKALASHRLRLGKDKEASQDSNGAIIEKTASKMFKDYKALLSSLKIETTPKVSSTTPNNN